MNEEEFENLVTEAFEELPEKIKKIIKNVAVIVEKKPSEEQLKKTGIKYGGILLGLYEGVPQTHWGKGFGMTLPDKITVFKESVENFAKTSPDIKKFVRNVVWHEIAHYFGFDEKETRRLETKWKKR